MLFNACTKWIFVKGQEKYILHVLKKERNQYRKKGRNKQTNKQTNKKQTKNMLINMHYLPLNGNITSLI